MNQLRLVHVCTEAAKQLARETSFAAGKTAAKLGAGLGKTGRAAQSMAKSLKPSKHKFRQCLACEWISLVGCTRCITKAWKACCGCRQLLAESILSLGAAKRKSAVWVTLRGVQDLSDSDSDSDGDELTEDVGQVLVQFELLPLGLAKDRLVGEGRAEPNQRACHSMSVLSCLSLVAQQSQLCGSSQCGLSLITRTDG